MCPLLQFLVKAAHDDEEVNQQNCNQDIIMKTISKHIFGNVCVNCITLTILLSRDLFPGGNRTGA
jgi:hypothetical protein